MSQSGEQINPVVSSISSLYPSIIELSNEESATIEAFSNRLEEIISRDSNLVQREELQKSGYSSWSKTEEDLLDEEREAIRRFRLNMCTTVAAKRKKLQDNEFDKREKRKMHRKTYRFGSSRMD